MFKIPAIPQWDALHPLLVHFPIALLLVVPLLIFLGLVWKKQRQCFFTTGLILMILGTIAVFFAVSTGEAAGELAERSAEMSPVLKRHNELAHLTQTIFTILTIVYAGILFLPSLLKKEIKPVLKMVMIIVFLIVYLLCSLVLANTADHGGRLVHQFGVHTLLSTAWTP